MEGIVINRDDQILDESYEGYLEEIITCVKKIYKENEDRPDLPYFTPHGPNHCKAVEDYICRLLPLSYRRNSNFPEREFFYLLASAWLHDLGMMTLVANEIWKDEHLNEIEIRKRHHETSEKYIVEHYKRCGINEADKEFLSKLCRYHRRQEDLNNCAEFMIVGNDKYRLKLLSAYLRLADSLHVDNSRVPSADYAVCLAYDIPAESKFHWVKSQLVTGIKICPEDHIISVGFKLPQASQLRSLKVDSKWIQMKIDYIIQLVIEDLREELSSVINVLTRAGITYFLDIEKYEIPVTMDNRTLSDLNELIVNYDSLSAPSASKLLELILMTISTIAGYRLVKNEEPINLHIDKHIEKRKEAIEKFVGMIEKDILNKRSCHLGLISLISDCNQYLKLIKNNSIDDFIEAINNKYQKYYESRSNIRIQAKGFFREIITKRKEWANSEIKEPINILLFGYSELVIKALCGFRDLFISNKYHADIKGIYNSPFEKEKSDNFRIFICEGQPKTQTGRSDRLLYHDGFQYAFTLLERNFSNLIMIPDAVVGNIIENDNIDFIIVGANGFTGKNFKHSAGHSTVINLAREYRSRKETEWPQILLISSLDKWVEKLEESSKQPEPGESSKTFQIEGFTFLNGPVNTREHIWFNRDETILTKCQGQNHNTTISFYNPREDIIKIDCLDWIITDKGYFKINSRYIHEIEDNKEILMNLLKSNR